MQKNSQKRRALGRMIALFVAGASLASGMAAAQPAPKFKVLALYSGTWDPAHISFVGEANQKLRQMATDNGFSYTASNDWNQLNAANLAQYKVVLFLDESPKTAAQRSAFQQYMQNGGGWMGFHVTAWNDNPGAWSWYYNTFLGTGAFRGNTWAPSAVTLRVDDRTHPTTTTLPSTFRSAVSEWYSWSNDLRNNPNIRILASIDSSSYPVGNQEGNIWRSGYYPIIWTNRNFKMIYANFGHNAMNYQTNTALSSTFASEVQNRFIVDSLLWLGGASTTPPQTGPIDPSTWYSVVNRNGKCVDAREAASANGTVVQQYACNGSNAQKYQFQPTSDGYVRINNNTNSAQVIDVAGVSAADNAPLQLWTYSNGNNQQWQPVAEADGYFHFVSRHSGKCLSVVGAADSAQLVQLACNNGAAQSFRVSP